LDGITLRRVVKRVFEKYGGVGEERRKTRCHGRVKDSLGTDV
jgi:hypothetical protein